jgi:hypothetical protein
MPVIGWVFLLAALGLVAGSLLILRNSASKMHIPKDKIDKIRKRKAELEAQEKADDDQR